jgi:hypothetical protein
VVVTVFEGVGETILTVAEALTSTRTCGCGVRLGGRGNTASNTLDGPQTPHPASPTDSRARTATGLKGCKPSFIPAGRLLLDHHISRVVRHHLQI